MKTLNCSGTHKFIRNYITSLQSADGTLVTDHGHKVAILWTTFMERLSQSDEGQCCLRLTV
jgi:hypothetical protein